MERRTLLKAMMVGCGMTLTPRLLAEEVEAPQDPARLKEKIENFDKNFSDDIYLTSEQSRQLRAIVKRMSQVQNVIGYARFNLLSFDELLKIAHQRADVGSFSPAEITFMEETFFFDATQYGFYGEKVVRELTSSFSSKDLVKIPGSGHYIFKGRPLTLYKKVIADVGSDIILTSGIRSVVKQMYLFYCKTMNSDDNLSRASRSLAPPGHFYHGISDFDVGQVGWGYRNFSDQFARSEVFKKLTDLGYVDLRYEKFNTYGVRFEPWHIKVA
jgi:hypothetical protein